MGSPQLSGQQEEDSFLDSQARGTTLGPSVLTEVVSLEGRVGQGFVTGRSLLGLKGLGRGHLLLYSKSIFRVPFYATAFNSPELN